LRAPERYIDYNKFGEVVQVRDVRGIRDDSATTLAIVTGAKIAQDAGKAAIVSTRGQAGKLPPGQVSPASVDVNKLHHLFGRESHNLERVVSEFGSREAAYASLKSATEAAVKANGITGTFKVVVQVGGSQVTVRGNVVDGAVKIGTAFIP
jgi:hypothetical protein